MKEHNEIDELFKNGLEDFQPDATHLSYAPIASAVGSSAATAAKTGFLAKWGLTIVLGTTAVAGTTIAVFLQQPEVSLKTAAYQVTATPVLCSDKTPFSSLVEATEDTTYQLTPTLYTDKNFSVADYPNANHAPAAPQKITVATRGRVATGYLTSADAAVTPGQREVLQPSGALEPVQPIVSGSLLKGGEGLESIPVASKRGQSVARAYLQLHTPALWNKQPLSQQDTTLFVTGTSVMPTDSTVETTAWMGPDVQPVFAKKRSVSFRAGLAYVPLQQTNQLIETNTPDSIEPIFWGVEQVMRRPSTKNELLLSLHYEQEVRPRFFLGAGFSMLQGGWHGYNDLIEQYWVDNGDGTISWHEDTTTMGEWDVRYRAMGIHGTLGYHFPIGTRWNIALNGGVSGAQVFVTNDYRSYSANKPSTANSSRFALSLFALGELTYRVGPIGLSAGVSLNGRSELSRVFFAQDFYNNVSFGLHTGIHYYLTPASR